MSDKKCIYASNCFFFSDLHVGITNVIQKGRWSSKIQLRIKGFTEECFTLIHPRGLQGEKIFMLMVPYPVYAWTVPEYRGYQRRPTKQIMEMEKFHRNPRNLSKYWLLFVIQLRRAVCIITGKYLKTCDDNVSRSCCRSLECTGECSKIRVVHVPDFQQLY